MKAKLGPLHLRPICLTDAGRVHEWASREESCQYQPWGPNTVSDTETFVRDAVRAWDVRPQRRWVWAAVDPTNVAYGIGEVKARAPQRAEISYAVHHEHWGEGVGSCIARALVDWAFEELPELERLEATCDPRNGASGSILMRVGMTHEGTLRHVMKIREGWRDSKMFSLLRSEWTADK